MNYFAFVVLSVGGFTACAEFGSYAFVHPVIRRLPPVHHVEVERGLLKTFGRVMPVAMTLTVVLAIAYAVHAWGDGGAPRILACGAAVTLVVALVSTIIFNVPINRATGKWDPEHPPETWKATRDRWEFFQALRSWLLLIGFVLLAATVSAQLP
ncbi:anthrone oxygenase family protein [Nocardia sp. NPDC059240]|uniref:anthrone oxygenase family protein n=1 Tax=Nocardia sp. NPDC059240 TaxID=3346786 RepID=UPI0036B78673